MFSDEFTIAWPFFFASIIASGLAINAVRRKRSATTLYFTLCMVAAAVWSVSSGLHLIVESFGAKLFWADSKFLFITTLPVFWVLLAQSFSNAKFSFRLRTVATLMAIPAVTVFIVATNGWHHLFFKEAGPLVTERFVSVTRVYGPWFWIHTAYSYALILTGVGLFVRCIYRTKGYLRNQAIIMSVGSVIPFVFNAIYLSNQDAFYYLDFTPVAFAATGVVYFVGLFRYRMLDLMPIAREEVVRTMEDAVIVTDVNGFIVDTNEAASALKNKLEAPEIGQSVLDVFPFLKHICHSARTTIKHSDELFVESGNLTAWYRVDVKVIVNKRDQIEGRLIVLRDISETKDAQLQLQNAKQKAEELSQLKSAFLSNMSHDVRTPLAGIIGLAEVLAEECDGDKQQFAELIKESGDRLLKLINSLLSVSHLSSGTLDQNAEHIDLIELSRRVLAPVEKDLDARGIVLETDLPETMLSAEHDPNHLSHALTHILDHACKYTESGSIEFQLQEEDTSILFSVRDTGRGFEPGYILSIGQPLDFNVLAEFDLEKGSSLGLRVANGLIEEMGGRLDITSQIGEGTEFSVRLPKVSNVVGVHERNRLPIARKMPQAHQSNPAQVGG